VKSVICPIVSFTLSNNMHTECQEKLVDKQSVYRMFIMKITEL
jgi:hypothetical protein